MDLQAWSDWALFAGVMALGQFSPGPDMIFLTRVALRDGKKPALLVVLGIVTGLCLHAAVAIGGLSALLAQGGGWERALSILAAAYLGWLGWQMIRTFVIAHVSAVRIEEPQERRGTWYLKGLLCNLLNPKVVVFFGGLSALFLQRDHGTWWPFVLWLTVVAEGLVLWGLWVLVLQKRPVREFYQQQGKWFDLAFGLGLWGLAGLLVWHAFGG